MKYIGFDKKEINYLSELLFKLGLDLEKDDYDFMIINKIRNKLMRCLNTIKIRSRKSKGKNLQQWVCNKLANILEIEYKQNDDQCLIHSREMSQSGLDVILRGGVLKKLPLSIECKSSESFNISKTIEQVKNNQIKETDWLIVYKRKMFSIPIIIIDWDFFERMLKIYINRKDRKYE